MMLLKLTLWISFFLIKLNLLIISWSISYINYYCSLLNWFHLGHYTLKCVGLITLITLITTKPNKTPKFCSYFTIKVSIRFNNRSFDHILQSKFRSHFTIDEIERRSTYVLRNNNDDDSTQRPPTYYDWKLK